MSSLGTPSRTTTTRADVAVCGAGIMGLAVAVDAVQRGLEVVVVERDDHANGASIRNFGHVFVTGQAGAALEAAEESRTRWLRLARDAGFWLEESGSVVVARGEDELAVLEEFVADRDDAHLLGREAVLDRVPVIADGIVGGLWAPRDLRVDARTAIPALTSWLAEERGVRFLWRTTSLGAEPGSLHTSRGDIAAPAIVVATGHDLDRMYPALADETGLRRCALHMLRVAAPGGRRIVPALLTGLCLLRYGGFAACPSLAALRARFARERPDLVEAEVNLIVTRRPDGDLIIGDTHAYGRTPAPFQDERLDLMLLREIEALLGVAALEVRERWRGAYAHAPDRAFLVATPAPGVRAVAVTSGIGMTTALGLAPRVLDDLLATT